MGVLKRGYHPSKDEIWEQLSESVTGKYADEDSVEGSRATFKHGEWTITMDSYTTVTGDISTVYTRIRAPYVNKDGFRFSIYPESLFTHISHFLGSQDVETGDEFFDKHYVIKATDEEKVRALLSDTCIKTLIETQPDIHFSVKDDEGWFGTDFPDGVDELYFECVGLIQDTKVLEILYELFAECLDQLCRLGSAYDTDPKVNLD